MIVSGRIVGLLSLVLIIAMMLWYMEKGKRGKLPRLRKLAVIDAFPEVVGRATEMGRPVYYLLGEGRMDRPMDMPATVASFAPLQYVAELCAKYDAKLHVPTELAVAYDISYELVRSAYLKAGKIDKFDPTYTVLYVGGYGQTYYVLNSMWRERVAGTFIIGSLYHQAILFAEVGARAGALQIGGTDTTHNIPFLVSACDYGIIGEEIYALSAYLSKDPIPTGQLAGQDIGKILAVILILGGTLLLLAGFDIRRLLTM